MSRQRLIETDKSLNLETKTHQDKDILAVQHYLESNFSQRLTLNTVARLHNMTERTLIRRFKQACQLTPLQFLQSVRLEHARKLLETSHASLEAVVNEVGYEDLSSCFL